MDPITGTALAPVIVVKDSPRARKEAARFHHDPMLSVQAGEARWWLFWRDGAHRVGLFSASQVEQMLDGHRAQGQVVSVLEAR